MINKSRTVIIVAGGKGERMQSNVPKQFLPLHGEVVLMHTIRLFFRFDPECRIIVVLPESQFSNWKELCKLYNFAIPHSISAGGATRYESVKNGLALASGDGLIAVHDGVRPLASTETLTACFNTAGKCGTAIPVVDAIESIRKICDKGSVAVDRSLYKLVQTPQVFEASLLKKAYEQDYSPLFTDDASVVEALGYAVELVPGNPENIKITTPGDLLIAEVLIKPE